MYGTAKFLLSAGDFTQLPSPAGDEFALLGRSNVGKSSFINHACAVGGLARTSKRPGTTVCANYYFIDETTLWVDLPGYGFASAGGRERGRWSSLIRDYCNNRENLRGIIWLVDIRHIGVAMDREAWDWLRGLKAPVLPILAKGDKVSGSERRTQVKVFAREFPGFADPVVYSTLEHESRERFWERFAAWKLLVVGKK